MVGILTLSGTNERVNQVGRRGVCSVNSAVGDAITCKNLRPSFGRLRKRHHTRPLVASLPAGHLKCTCRQVICLGVIPVARPVFWVQLCEGPYDQKALCVLEYASTSDACCDLVVLDLGWMAEVKKVTLGPSHTLTNASELIEKRCRKEAWTLRQAADEKRSHM